MRALVFLILISSPWFPLLSEGSPCVSTNPIPFGDWKVTAHYEPGIHAMGPKEADALVGSVASYFESEARFAGNRCDEPKYSTRTFSAEEFSREFRADPELLGLRAECLCVTKVLCPRNLDFSGEHLIYDQGVVLALVEGVFFRLKKLPRSQQSLSTSLTRRSPFPSQAR